jgi:hypothetical protein
VYAAPWKTPEIDSLSRKSAATARDASAQALMTQQQLQQTLMQKRIQQASPTTKSGKSSKKHSQQTVQ